MNTYSKWLASLTMMLFISSTIAYGEPSETKRLEEITASFEQLRQELKIPGMALAIVKDDKIILAKGFGYRDVEGKKIY